MTNQTDRIKQMAQEAGFPSMAVDNMRPQDAGRLAKFAALVAEDCARVCKEQDSYDGTASDCIDAIRTRYGLKGE